MARILPLFFDVPNRRLVRNFSSAPAEPLLPPLYQGCDYMVENRFGEWDVSLQQWRQVEPPSSFRLAAGELDARPESGTFTLSDGIRVTPAISISASAAAVAAALASASPSAITGWTVTKGDASIPLWTFTRTLPGAVAYTLSADVTGLQPSSFADCYKLRDGATNAIGVQEVDLYARPAGYQDTWAPLPSTAPAVEVLELGTTGVNAQQKITFSPVPIGGSYVLQMPNGNPTGAIKALATADEVLTAIKAVTGYTVDGDVDVQGGEGQPLVITFQGTLSGTEQSQMNVQSSGLIYAKGLKGILSLRTPMAKSLVRRRVTTITLEAKSEDAGAPDVLAQRTVTLGNSLIETNTAAAPAVTPWLTGQTGVVNGAAEGITSLAGGVNSLSAVPTLTLASAVYHVVDEAYGAGIWELVSGNPPMDLPDVVRPADYDDATNVKVWRRRSALSLLPGGFASGSGPVLSRYGERVHAAGWFGAPGDAQMLDILVRGETADASPLELLAGFEGRIDVAFGQMLFLDVMVAALGVDAEDAKLFRRQVAVVQNGSSGVVLVGAVKTIGTDEYNGSASTWSVDITANNGALALQITVTGGVGQNVRWLARVSGCQVQFQS